MYAIIQLYLEKLLFFLKTLFYFCDQILENMLQRIQTVYLLIAAIVSLGLIFVFALWQSEEGSAVYAQDQLTIFIMFIASGLLSLISVFMFKNRKLQFVLGRINIILNFFLLGVFVYWSLSLPGEMNISEKGIGMFLPIISIVFLVLANKAIKKDEDLVKSVDRLR
ncbi:membrane protein [Zunongwangia profunda SM-A87]|uniref:Membrane protein n=2 Tax=Zunongwangia profunda TaxID=398743 RepID=D5BHS9_ZUNPS|nr:membrane protein [Zunongwangia profunda SM-A87]